MKYSKDELINLVTASALALVLYEIAASYMPLSYASLSASFVAYSGWIVLWAQFTLLLLVASVPVIFLMRWQRVKRPLGSVLLGAPIAVGLFFSFSFTPDAIAFLLNRSLCLYLSIFVGFVVANYVCRFLGGKARSKIFTV